MTLKWAGAAGLQSITAGMEWPSVTGTPTIETTIKRDSGAAWRIAPGATKQHQHNSYKTAQGVNYYRIYLYLVTAPAATRPWVSIDNGASRKISIRITNGRVLQLFNEEDSAQIGSDSSAINTGEFYRLELKVDDTTLASTSVEARLYAASAESTLAWNPSGTADMSVSPNRFSIGNNNDANLDFVYTDVVIIAGDATAPNSWAGQGSIVYLRPDGNSGTPQWTRGGADSGANWSQNDETPPNDATDYVESATSGQIDDYTLGATPAAVQAGDVINWVVPGVRFAISNTTGGDPDFVLRVTAGGNTDESGNVSGAGATAYASYETTPVCVFPLVLVDMPGASTTAWTKTDLDSATIGIRESATDTHLARVSAMWLMFDHAPGAGPTATASITEGADTISASATVAVAGSAAITESADTLSASGTTAVSASPTNYKITVDNTSNSSTLSQYSIQINLTSSNFGWSGVQPDGSDLRVLDSDGSTVIPYYIRSIDTAARTAEIWARVDSIPGSGTKTIYVSKGNSTSAFRIPPTGKFTRPTSSVAAGLAENMVYDSGTNKYYIVTSSTTSGPIKLYSSATPGGTWTDEGTILNVGSAGTWDDFIIYAPHLVQDSGTWYLFYTGGPDATENSNSIGYATASSITGPYTRYASNPILTYTGTATFDQYRASECYVFYSNILSQWVMFYMGDSGSGTGSQIETVGYATASAITGPWSKCGSNPVISYVTGPDWRDTQTAADPFVVEIGAAAYVFVTGGKENHAWTVGVFKTTDYATFTEIGQVLGTGPTGRFDDSAAFRGAVLLVGDTWYLPYAGFDGTTFAWGVASMSALSTAAGFDPWQVFDYFDEFPGASLDANSWSSITGSNSGTTTVSGSVLTMAITSGSNVHRTLAGHREFGIGYLMEAYIRHSTGTSGSTNAAEVGFAEESDRFPVDRIYQYDSASVRKENVSNAGASSLSNMSQAISTGWQKWSVAFISSSSIGYRVDSNSWETIGTNVSDRVLKPWLFAFRGSANVSLEVDWVIVRKYANPEPAYSIDTVTIIESADTISAAAIVGVPASANAAITEASDTVLASGAVAVNGSLTQTESADTISASGSVEVSASASITEGADTLSASGAVAVGVTGDISESADTVSVAGTVLVSGTATITEGADTLATSGAVSVAGSASITEDADTLNGLGVVGSVPATGDGALTEGADTISANATVAVAGSVAINEDADTISASGVVAVYGVATITEGADTLSTSGAVTVSGSGSITETADTISASVRTIAYSPTAWRVEPTRATVDADAKEGITVKRSTIPTDRYRGT